MIELEPKIIECHKDIMLCNGTTSTIILRSPKDIPRKIKKELRYIHGYVQGVPTSYGKKSIIPKSYYGHEYTPIFIKSSKTPLDQFMEKLKDIDRDYLQKSIHSIKNLQFVEKIEFEEIDNNPTIIIRLSEMNRDTIKRIHEIEYDLLKDFKEDTNFIVFPI